MIRHAAPAAFPVVPLPVAVIEPPLPALLVPPVGVPPLLPLFFCRHRSPQYRWPRSQWQQIQNTAPQPTPRQIRRRRSSSRVPIPALAAGGDNREPSWQSRSHLQMT